MESSEPLSREELVGIAADNLRADAATAEVLRALEAASLPSVLLKGRSIASWLYSEDNPRPYRDCDLLVPPGEEDHAGQVLTGLGFTRRFEEDDMPDWWRHHASEWWRSDDRMLVDLHRSLPGVGVTDEVAWRVLSQGTATISIVGQPAQILSIPARALHVVLHATQHGVDWYKPMRDLELALARADDSVWDEAAQLARELDAIDAFAVGLRMNPSGDEVADRLGLPSGGSVDAILRASTPPPVALGLEQLAQAPGLRARVEILWRKFVPPASFMRRWHPIATRGRVGLLLAYLWRPIWILRATPQAIEAWRRARRDASGR